MITQLPRASVIAAAKQCLAQIQATRDRRKRAFLNDYREPGPKWLRRLLKLQPLSDAEIIASLDFGGRLMYTACELACHKQFDAATKILRLAQSNDSNPRVGYVGRI